MNESVASDPTLNFVEALIFYNNMNKKHFVEKYSAKFGNHLLFKFNINYLLLLHNWIFWCRFVK